VAFMMTLPDLNELTRDLNGSLLPFGWAKLLWRLRKPRVRTMRVPLMGVVKRLQASRLASQLAFTLIEYIRRASVARYGATRGEIGWILEDNQGMVSIAENTRSKVNRVYRIYEKAL
ncbi:MAG TPA: N-acetyltransferase, partial [Allosphingosinicella sp.]|nr:N-acetyltransferase [Allosphingosinicella sp.]